MPDRADPWLRPDGLVAVAAPSRHDSPELAHALAETVDAPLSITKRGAPAFARRR